MEFTDFSDIG